MPVRPRRPTPAAYHRRLFITVADSRKHLRSRCGVIARQVVLLVAHIIPAQQGRPVGRKRIGGKQVRQPVAAQAVAVGGVVETVARQGHLDPRFERAQAVDGAQVGVLVRAARQPLAAGLVFRILQVDAGGEIESGGARGGGQAHALQLRAVDVVGAAELVIGGAVGAGRGVDQQVGQAVAVHAGAQRVDAVVVAQAQFRVAALFRAVGGIAVGGIIKFVVGGRAKAGAHAGGGAQGRRKAVAGRAGGLVAILRFVAPHAGVEQAGAAARVVRRRKRIGAAFMVQGGGAVGRHFFFAVVEQQLQYVGADQHVVLPAEVFLGAVDARVAGSGGARIIGALVPRFGVLQHAGPGWQRARLGEDGRVGQLRFAAHVVGAGAIVVLRVQPAVQRERADFAAAAQLQAQLRRQVGLVVAIAVGVVGAAAGAGGGKAVGGFGADTEGVAEAVLTAGGAGDAGIEFVGLVAAGARKGGNGRGAAARLGKNLDHAADGIGPVQGAQGAVDDFNVVDGGEGNGAPVGGARGGGADAHAVDEDDVLVAVGAADVHAGAGAGAAVAGHFDAALALQQVDDGAGARLGNLRGVDGDGVADDVGHRLRIAGGGDDDSGDGFCVDGGCGRHGDGQCQRRQGGATGGA